MNFKRTQKEYEIGDRFKNAVGIILTVKSKTQTGYRMEFNLPGRNTEDLHYTDSELKKMQRLDQPSQQEMAAEYLRNTRK